MLPREPIDWWGLAGVTIPILALGAALIIALAEVAP